MLIEILEGTRVLGFVVKGLGLKAVEKSVNTVFFGC